MVTYRPIEKTDRDAYLRMAQSFYDSDAVLHPIPTAHITATFDEMMQTRVYADAVMFESDGETVGYALLAKTFSQEAGGKVWWVEELYVESAHRSKKIGWGFWQYLLDRLPKDVKRVRLEVERENGRAVKLYESLGFSFLRYDQMILEPQQIEEKP